MRPLKRFLSVLGISLLTVALSGCIEEAEQAATELPTDKIGPASGALVKVEKKEFTGMLAAGTLDPVQLTCGAAGEGVDRKTFDWTFTEKESDGTPTKVNKVILRLTGGSSAIDNDLYFYDPEGEELASGVTPEASETIEVTKLLEPGKYKVVVVSCLGANSNFKVEAEATYVVA